MDDRTLLICAATLCVLAVPLAQKLGSAASPLESGIASARTVTAAADLTGGRSAALGPGVRADSRGH